VDFPVCSGPSGPKNEFPSSGSRFSDRMKMEPTASQDYPGKVPLCMGNSGFNSGLFPLFQGHNRPPKPAILLGCWNYSIYNQVKGAGEVSEPARGPLHPYFNYNKGASLPSVRNPPPGALRGRGYGAG